MENLSSGYIMMMNEMMCMRDMSMCKSFCANFSNRLSSVR